MVGNLPQRLLAFLGVITSEDRVEDAKLTTKRIAEFTEPFWQVVIDIGSDSLQLVGVRRTAHRFERMEERIGFSQAGIIFLYAGIDFLWTKRVKIHVNTGI